MEEKQKKSIKKRPILEIEETIIPSEIEEPSIPYDKIEKPIKVNLKKRKSKSLVDKHTPIWKLEEFFIDDRKAKGNSAATIDYYERAIKKFNIFLATEFTEHESYLQLIELYDNSTNKGLEMIGKMLPISALEVDNITLKYREFLRDFEELNPKTVNSYLTGYRVLMYYAMENGWIEPFRIPIQNVETPLKQTYTETELKRLLKKPDIDDFVQYRNWVIINWFIATGCRVSSTCDVKVKDILLDERQANINRQKNGEPIRIPLVSRMLNILREYIHAYREDDEGIPLEEEYLFCTFDGERLSEQGLKTAIKKYNLSRGVKKTSCHLFRHTFCKDWILRGGDQFTLQRILGHKSLKMVSYYANLYLKDTVKKAEEFSLLSNMTKRGGKKLKRRI